MLTTNMLLNRMSLNDIMQASACFLHAYNSKGHVVPLHIKGAPGTAKTMLARTLAMNEARAMPGVPFGFGTVNVGIINPTDAAGIQMFRDITHPDDHPAMPGVTEQVSMFIRPVAHILGRVFVADPSATPGDTTAKVRQVTRDVNGQPIFPFSIIKCPWTGARLSVRHGIYLLDEFMQGDPDVRKVFAPFLDERRLGVHELPPTFKVIAASNRAEDKSGVGKGLAFVTSRTCDVAVEHDTEGLQRYFTRTPGSDSFSGEPVLPMRLPQFDDQGFFMPRPAHPVVHAFIEQNADIFKAGVPEDPNAPSLNGRTMEAVANLFDIMMCYEEDSGEVGIITTSDDPLRCRLFTAFAAGLIGSDNAVQFMATVELFGEVPRLSEIVAEPRKATVSDKKDAQLIAAYVCADGMTLKNGNAIVEYAQRLNPAFLGNVIVKAVSRNAELMGVGAVATYFAKHPTAIHRMVSARAKAAQAAGRKL